MAIENNNSTESSFNSAPAIIVFVCLECLVMVQALLAWQGHFFTVSQMRQVGVNQGLPFVWHFGMWGDLLIVSGLAAYVVGRHSVKWNNRKVLVSFLLGFALAAILSWVYTFSGMPEAHLQRHRLTVLGIIHLFYMGIALAMFIQFFFFTDVVSTVSLRTTSLLLFIQVFVGTHMALGILNIASPRAWYPAQPLKSALGWVIVAAVGVGLLWLNIGTSAITKFIGVTGRSVYEVAMWLMNQPTRKSSESYLKFLTYLCGCIVGAVYFFNISVSTWRVGGLSMPVVLIALLGIVYYLSMLSVKQELAIVQLVFPPDRVPDEFKFENRLKITFQVTIFTLCYVLLGLFSQSITIASFLMLIIACIDVNTRKQINARIREYFADAKFSPRKSETNYKAIRRSRWVIRWFLFRLPHLWKEAARAIGCAVAFGAATYGHLVHSRWWNNAAYVTLIATLLVNEILTIRWRWKRHVRLKRMIGNSAVLTP